MGEEEIFTEGVTIRTCTNYDTKLKTQNNMVTINPIQFTVANGMLTPKLHIHNLTCIKSAPTFDIGENLNCYITKYDSGRFAVFSTSGKNTKYNVFESEAELHEHFEEQ